MTEVKKNSGEPPLRYRAEKRRDHGICRRQIPWSRLFSALYPPANSVVPPLLSSISAGKFRGPASSQLYIRRQIPWSRLFSALYPPANSVVPPLLSSISQGGFTGNFFYFGHITAIAFSYIRTEFGASRSMRVGVRLARN